MRFTYLKTIPCLLWISVDDMPIGVVYRIWRYRNSDRERPTNETTHICKINELEYKVLYQELWHGYMIRRDQVDCYHNVLVDLGEDTNGISKPI
jgi:hypothetical protein